MLQHIKAINHLIATIDSAGYSSRGNLLLLSPDWMELKEHVCELTRGIVNE